MSLFWLFWKRISTFILDEGSHLLDTMFHLGVNKHTENVIPIIGWNLGVNLEILKGTPPHHTITCIWHLSNISWLEDLDSPTFGRIEENGKNVRGW